MKKTVRFLFLAAACTILSCAPKTGAPSNKAEKVIAAIHDPSSKYVVVACHRGDWRNYPENSLGAIESVIRMGADIVEIDLKLTKDSVLVLSHDRTCNRMTTGKGDISTMTYDSLATFNLKTAHNVAIPGTRITTFREALELCKDRIVINVDQGFQYYDLVVKLTDSLDMTDQILIKGKKAREVVAGEMEGSRITSVSAWQMTNETRHTFHARIFADFLRLPVRNTGRYCRLGRHLTAIRRISRFQAMQEIPTLWIRIS